MFMNTESFTKKKKIWNENTNVFFSLAYTVAASLLETCDYGIRLRIPYKLKWFSKMKIQMQYDISSE